MNAMHLLVISFTILLPFLVGRCFLRLWALERDFNPFLKIGLSMP